MSTRRAFAFAISVFVLAEIALAQLWWERGADRWYYKDDWKGQAITGAGQSVSKTIQVPGGAKSGWIVVWGDRGYRLQINQRVVGQNIDGGLIDDYGGIEVDSAIAGEERVTIRLGGGEVCAEGEIVGKDGKRYAFATGEDWTSENGGKVRARKMTVGPSSGAFNRAHNGRLITYNDEERGKTAIAKDLARIQKLNDQGIFLMKRFRPASEIISFDESVPWTRAEKFAGNLANKSRGILKDRAIPAQQARQFSEAIAAADQAGVLLAAAESSIGATTELYRAEREATHLGNWAAMIGGGMADELQELWRSARMAREAHALNDWATVSKSLERLRQQAMDLRRRIELAAGARFKTLVGGLGELDEFPEDRFAWLNARELMGNDPVNWPFVVSPSDSPYMDLSGLWDFRTDPDGVGEKEGWTIPDDMRPVLKPAAESEKKLWRKLFVPRPWERQGVQEDNRKASNPPVITNERFRRTTGEDKPYNGWAWYRKQVIVPTAWRGKRIVMSCGVVANWGRVFWNEKGLDPITRPGEQRGIAQSGIVKIPQELIQFGSVNSIAIQVYNHDNFGGIVQGEVALYAEDQKPRAIETALPMGYAKEVEYKNHRLAFLTSAMSPGIVVASDSATLEFCGWEGKGHPLPEIVQFVGPDGRREIQLKDTQIIRPDQSAKNQSDALLGENWLLLQGKTTNALIVPETIPDSVRWNRTAQGTMGLSIAFRSGPCKAIVLCFPADAKITPELCRFWEQSLRGYPVSATECVTANSRRVRYNYLNIQGPPYDDVPPRIAPLPMLASYGLQYKYPGLIAEGLRETAYRSQHASYRVKQNSDTIEYQAPAVDRTKVMKGVGELFARKRAADNVHGGLGEIDMFKRFADWGFDHCRYALAFDADWDLPMVANHTRITDDEAIWKRLDELVANCNKAGVQMMLCWFPEIGTRRWRDNPEWEKTTLEWWRRMAKRYAGLPEWAISYDPFNEPAYVNTDHWNQIMRDLTASIRSVDKKHMIVWESADGWAQPQWCMWMQPVNDANVMYSFHHYGKHWGYAYDEYYPSYQNTHERTHIDVWLEAMLFGIKHHVPIHCGEFGISMIQPGRDGEAWLEDYLAFFERFGIGWNWWNYSGGDIYRTGLAAGDRISPYVPILRKWAARSRLGKSRGMGRQ